MHLENAIVVRAALDRVFPLVADVEDWPQILPHYRRVTVLESGPEGRLVDMSAWRGRIPVRWRAVQRIDTERHLVFFDHVRGATRGMSVEWSFRPITHQVENATPGQHVTIEHDLNRGSASGRWVSERIVGPFFIDYIARRTLARIKELAETDGRRGGS